MAIERPREAAPEGVKVLAERAEAFAVENMLRSVRVFDGEWIITVEEPSMYADLYGEDPDKMKITYEEFDL